MAALAQLARYLAANPSTAPVQISSEPVQQKDVFAEAMSKYPILRKSGVKGIMNLGGGDGYLEFWPPDERGTPDRPRPKSLGEAPGVEIYRDDTRPIDVLGDVVSHWLVEKDSKLKSYYDQFMSSMTPDQLARLSNQYNYARENYGEERPFSQWAERSGIPAYFRGYAFQQWEPEFNEEAYTLQQRRMFDEMMRYLSSEDD